MLFRSYLTFSVYLYEDGKSEVFEEYDISTIEAIKIELENKNWMNICGVYQSSGIQIIDRKYNNNNQISELHIIAIFTFNPE